MKPTLKLVLTLLLGLLLQGGAAQAQVRVSVNVGPPAWGPAVGPGVEYYYIPEIDGYYDLYARQYVYLDPYGYWVSTPYLPSYYAGYDPRFFHPVVIGYVGRQPWGAIYDHRAYCGQRGWQPGYYRGNQGYGYNRGGGPGYGVPQPAYRQAPGRYDNLPYNNRSYARSNDYERNSRGNYSPNNPNNGRDTRGYQSGPSRSDRNSQGSRDGQSSSPGGRGRGR